LLVDSNTTQSLFYSIGSISFFIIFFLKWNSDWLLIVSTLLCWYRKNLRTWLKFTREAMHIMEKRKIAVAMSKDTSSMERMKTKS